MMVSNISEIVNGGEKREISSIRSMLVNKWKNFQSMV